MTTAIPQRSHNRPARITIWTMWALAALNLGFSVTYAIAELARAYVLDGSIFTANALVVLPLELLVISVLRRLHSSGRVSAPGTVG